MYLYLPSQFYQAYKRWSSHELQFGLIYFIKFILNAIDLIRNNLNEIFTLGTREVKSLLKIEIRIFILPIVTYPRTRGFLMDGYDCCFRKIKFYQTLHVKVSRGRVAINTIFQSFKK